MNVIIIEGRPLSIQSIRLALSQLVSDAFAIEHVCNLSDALERMEHRKFDVVLADLMLPDSTGLDTFAELASKHPAIPIIVLASEAEEELAVETLRRGALDYLRKDEMAVASLRRALRLATERSRRDLAEQDALEAQRRERQRLSRELHDGIVQTLCSLRLQLQVLATNSTDSALRNSRELERIADVALDAIRETRRIARDLHPAILDKYEFGEALAVAGVNIQDDCGVAIQVVDRMVGELSWQAKHHLYRVFQEAVRNAVVHARVRSVRVELETRDDQFMLEISDGGDGFDLAVAENEGRGLGLISIRERARLLDARFYIESRKTSGTSVRIALPAGRHFHLLSRRQERGASRCLATSILGAAAVSVPSGSDEGRSLES